MYDGYCLFVGNLNNSIHPKELENALENFFMRQSLLVQDIRLHCAKKHAYIDMASEMDLTKALTLNGQTLLGKPLKIAKSGRKVGKDPLERKKARDARAVFVKNIPYSATKEDIFKVFPKATAVRFLGGTETPSKGIAFVDFQNEHLANVARQQSQKAKIQDRVLIVDVIGGSEISRTKDDANKTNDEDSPTDILYVSNLFFKVQEEQLKEIFPKAVNINIPTRKGKSRGFAFVEFASVADAENALESSQNSEILGRRIKVRFCLKTKPEKASVMLTTLIVTGLNKKTTAETLKDAFEGALNARIFIDKETGLSRKFGFVDFESPDSCRLAKESMEDCEIDGCKVTVAFARPKRSERLDRELGTSSRGENIREKGCGAGQPLLQKKEEVESLD